MGDWKRKSIAGGPTPEMGDWKRRSIAGGPSPETPNEIIPGALHLNLDFFYRPSAACIAFPCDRADQNGGHGRMAVTPPATMAPPPQAQQCQPAGTASTGGSGLRRGRSRLRVKVPSASQLPPLPEDAAAMFANVEFYSEDEGEAGEEEEAMLSGRSEEEEEGETISSGSSEEEGETMSSGSSEEEGETMSSGSSEEEGETMSSRSSEEEGETMSSGHSEEEEEAMSSGHSEEEEDGEAMSSGRSDKEEGDGEAMSPGRGEGEEPGEEAGMLPGDNEEDQVDAMLYCSEGEEALLSQSEEEEEEEEPEEVQDMCVRCESLERLVKLLPCRHASYCDRCFAIYDRRNTPARPQLCPVCRQPYTRGHPESGGLQPKPKKGFK